MARGLKFRIKVEEGLYYPYTENKWADQLRDYREADLRHCFRICKKPVFSRRGSYGISSLEVRIKILYKQRFRLRQFATETVWFAFVDFVVAACPMSPEDLYFGLVGLKQASLVRETSYINL